MSQWCIRLNVANILHPTSTAANIAVQGWRLLVLHIIQPYQSILRLYLPLAYKVNITHFVVLAYVSNVP